MTPKEKCFADALAAYKNAFPDKDPKVELFKDWYRDLDGKWHKADFIRSFSHWIGSILKTRLIARRLEDPRPPGEPNPVQWRTPDITASDNKVVDQKYTNAKGQVDPWGKQPGMGGQNQQEDQDAINKQADPNSGAMSLDKDSCRCDKRVLQPQKMYVHQPHSILLPPGLPEGLEEVIEGLEEAVETAE